MIRAMYSAVSGLKNHQTKMDVIANNISNVNTTAFKSSSVRFQEVYSQTLENATAGTTAIGGTNPVQIGVGVKIGSIDVNFTRSSTESTGNKYDLAIEGDGFFVVNDGSNDYFTRDGSFKVDNNGDLVTADGMHVLDSTGGVIETYGFTGVYINSNGEVRGDDGSDPDALIATIGLAMFPNPSGLAKAGGNLYAETQNSGSYTTSAPGGGGSGTLRPGELELSNVDLANEFTAMITTQRGYQANSRIITTADAMLEELVNIKR